MRFSHVAKVALSCLILAAVPSLGWAGPKAIAITQIATHPGIDAIRDGFIAEMARLGYRNGVDVVYEFTNANGDMPTAQQIAEKIARDKPSLAFAISTPSSQTVAKALRRTTVPLVFGAVTDPVAAGLVKSLREPGGNVTGTSDQWPVGVQFDLLRRLVPTVKKVGVIHNPGEANSASNLRAVRAALDARGLLLVDASVASTGEIATAAQSLVGKVDAIYVPADNTVISGMAAIVKIGEQNRLPVLPGVSSSIEVGGIGTLGPDYRDVGAQSARLADRVLKGERPAAISVSVVERFDYVFNVRSAAAMGVAIPADLKARASKVYE